MIRLFVYLFLFGAILYMLWLWGNRNQAPQIEMSRGRSRNWFRHKRNPLEIWVQVYETASTEEGRMIQARLQEEEVECVLYEQGKKDIHGNPLPGIGIAVPKSGQTRAQNVISRLPV